MRGRQSKRISFQLLVHFLALYLAREKRCRASLATASLIDCFGTLSDPRLDRTRCHKLIDILVIGFCATLAGGEGFSNMEQFGLSKEAWFRGFLELPNGIPSHDTFNRVSQALAPAAFCECFVRWTQGLRAALSREIVAVDGKALRRALGKGRRDALPYVVSAWASDNGLVIMRRFLRCGRRCRRPSRLARMNRLVPSTGRARSLAGRRRKGLRMERRRGRQ